MTDQVERQRERHASPRYKERKHIKEPLGRLNPHQSYARKKRNDFNARCEFLVRSEGLEPPRFYSLPPQGSASTNSATSALVGSVPKVMPDRINGAGCNKSGMQGQGLPRGCLTDVSGVFRPASMG